MEERALQVHGSFSLLDEAKQKRERNREQAAERRFERKIHLMRKEVGDKNYFIKHFFYHLNLFSNFF